MASARARLARRPAGAAAARKHGAVVSGATRPNAPLRRVSDRAAVRAGRAPARRGREAAAALARGDGERPRPTLERPPRAEFGDYSTNVALLLAPALKAPPREIAEAVGEDAAAPASADVLERVEVAGPGFLNVFLADAWFRARARADPRRRASGSARASCPEDARERILVEFVSANPTGPLTAASGRHAAYGDSLARVLEFAGHEIEREYYVNDYGTQVELFGESIAARMRGEELPEDGYQGDYVRGARRASSRAEGTRSRRPRRARAARRRADDGAACARRSSASGCASTASSPSATCTTRGAVERGARGARRASTCTSPRARPGCAPATFGDDKDRVLRRSSGELTYFAADIAYHARQARARLRPPDQRARAPTTTATWPRMKAAFAALGEPGPARARDHAARQRRRARRARADVQAQGRVRHARRADRRHRRRRRALLPAPALARHDARPRPRPGARAQPGEPGLLRAVRARADREHPAQRRRGARRGGAERADLDARARRRSSRPSGRSSSGCWSCRTRCARRRERRAPHRLTATRTTSPPTSTPSTATAAWSAPSRPSSRTCGSAWCASRRRRVIARVLDLLGVEAPERM